MAKTKKYILKGAVNMERVTTGINGFDDKLEGGFVPGSVVLIAGKAGTCKTL
ncbi:MAG: hypothetical protein KAJ20_02340, partial [Candidatus Aenigmarchaeota archaeon]|nr:hypothetical protein [Candidatus Aenigmarchaeota archaeon]